MGCANSACQGQHIVTLGNHGEQIQSQEKKSVIKRKSSKSYQHVQVDSEEQKNDNEKETVQGKEDVINILPVRTIQDELDNVSIDSNTKLFLDPRNAANPSPNDSNVEVTAHRYNLAYCKDDIHDYKRDQGFESDYDGDENENHKVANAGSYSPSFVKKKCYRRTPVSSPVHYGNQVRNNTMLQRQESGLSGKWSVTVPMFSNQGLDNSAFSSGVDEVEHFRQNDSCTSSQYLNGSTRTLTTQLSDSQSGLDRIFEIDPLTKRPPAGTSRRYTTSTRRQEEKPRILQRSNSHNETSTKLEIDDGDRNNKAEKSDKVVSASLAKALAFSNTHWTSVYESTKKDSDESQDSSKYAYSRSVSSGFKSLSSVSSAATESDIEEDNCSALDSMDSDTESHYPAHLMDQSDESLPESDTEDTINTTKTYNRPKAAGRSRSRPLLL